MSCKKDALLAKVSDLLLEKQHWVEDRLRDVSDLMKKAGKMPEVSCDCIQCCSSQTRLSR